MVRSAKSGVYQSPLGKLLTRQQTKLKAKQSMAKLLLIYTKNDNKHIAHLISQWINETNFSK
jgi:hypothetical protein